jgi:hypothetical protein
MNNKSEKVPTTTKGGDPRRGQGAAPPPTPPTGEPPPGGTASAGGQNASEPVIDSVFQSHIPPPTDGELAGLEAQLLKDGECRDALVVWKEENLLLDGHNRLAICKKHGLKYDVKYVSLPDREAALNWMVTNQLGRRNLPPETAAYLRGKRYRAEVKQGDRTDLTGGQTVQKTTARRLAADYKVDEKTIRRDADFSRWLDIIAQNCGDEVRQRVIARDLKLPRAKARKLAEMLPSEQKVAVRSLLEDGKLPKQPKRKRPPIDGLLAAWDKVPGKDQLKAVRSLVANSEFAALLKDIWPGKAEPDDEEYRGEEE